MMNIYFDMRMLSVYTNLEIAHDFSGMVEQYDELCRLNLLDGIIAKFNNEYNRTYQILEDMLDEILIYNSIDVQVVKIGKRINNILNSITDELGNLNFGAILPDGVDLKSLVEIANVLK